MRLNIVPDYLPFGITLNRDLGNSIVHGTIHISTVLLFLKIEFEDP